MSLRMPVDYGLFAGRFLIRKHNSPFCIYLMLHWWREISSRSIRDQISLPFVIYRLSILDSVSVEPASLLSKIVCVRPHLRYSTYSEGMSIRDIIAAFISMLLYKVSHLLMRLKSCFFQPH